MSSPTKPVARDRVGGGSAEDTPPGRDTGDLEAARDDGVSSAAPGAAWQINVRRVESLMCPHVETIAPRASVGEAAQRLRDGGLCSLIVCSQNRPLGVITERDLVRVLASVLETGQSPTQKVCDLMSRPAICVRAGSTLAMASYKLARNEIRRVPVVDASGELVGVVTQTDLLSALAEEVRKHEEFLELELDRRTRALSHENTRLEAAARFSADFLAQMSHEIRTPMTAILGFAESLAEEELAEDERNSAARTIVDSGRHILELLNDILDLSKIEAGKLRLELSAISPFRMIEEVEKLVSTRVAEKGLSLRLQRDGPIPARFSTDQTRLRQILLNLLSNAVKFTERGSVTIALDYLPNAPQRDSDTVAGQLLFSVSDSGIGMSESQLAGIFQPYSQAEVSTARRFGGTGLGLSITKNLVELLGGTIRVTSEEGHGATFVVSLPVAAGAEVRLIDYPHHLAEDRQDRRREQSGAELLPRLEGRILLVEDVRTNQIVIERILAKAGAEVAIADNGQIGVAMAQEYEGDRAPYDLILMDTKMPVMNGWEATKALRDWGYAGPIIALTASAILADRDTSLAMGCNAVATKPIDRRELLEVIRTHLEAHKGEMPADTATAVGVSSLEQPGRDPTRAEGGRSPGREKPPLILTDIQYDILGELLNLSLGRAAASLSEMTSEEVLLSAPMVELQPRAQIQGYLDNSLSRKLSGVRQGFSGAIDGSASLFFAQEKILDLVTSVMAGHLPPDLTSELEDDILSEVGNIILTGCISTLADTLAIDLEPELPRVVRGSSADLIGSDDEEVSYVLAISIDFSLESREIPGHLAFLLDFGATGALLRVIDDYLVRLGIKK